ncbi:MAG: hypothetical protein GY819_05360 [Planctomycetaceae bacterium]|nr:hypothetical protein [Planctomycetaceae bacterium]MDG1809550.1 hypothetical protein [Pirellulaceae bacterium]
MKICCTDFRSLPLTLLTLILYFAKIDSEIQNEAFRLRMQSDDFFLTDLFDHPKVS